MSVERRSKVTQLIALVVVSVSVVGYFTSIQSPMNAMRSNSKHPDSDQEVERIAKVDDGVLPATHYTEMAKAQHAHQVADPPASLQAQLARLNSTIDLLAEVQVTSEEKIAALDRRKQNRAFNGAPPTIPHPIQQRSDVSCVACHGTGLRTKSLRIPRMSHGLMSNCTQCHVESNAQHQEAIAFRENSFAGLEAPQQGPRAFQGAPPQIPHSTWMRSDCMSCHGYAGLQGIRTTHPWRTNCQQCHAPSATSEQSLLAAEPQFLPGPTIEE